MTWPVSVVATADAVHRLQRSSCFVCCNAQVPLIKLSQFKRVCNDGGSHVVEEVGVFGVHTGPNRGIHPHIRPILSNKGPKERVRCNACVD